MRKYGKKLLCMALTAVCTFGMITGCGDGSESSSSGEDGVVEITNVSYDPTRELYAAYNELFKEHWKEKTG